MKRWSAADVPDLSDRTIVVTGANSGIGLEAARELVGRGAHVVLAVRDRAKGEQAAARLAGPARRGSSSSTCPNGLLSDRGGRPVRAERYRPRRLGNRTSHSMACGFGRIGSATPSMGHVQGAAGAELWGVGVAVQMGDVEQCGLARHSPNAWMP